MRMSTWPSPGSGIRLSVNSKLSRLGAPSGRLFSKIWRLTLGVINLPSLKRDAWQDQSAGRTIAKRTDLSWRKDVWLLILWKSLVGAPRFELGTPSPPDWCANRAALRSADADL